jgi:hypothetical protein
MKTVFLAVMLIGLIVFGTHDVQAQAYGPYYYPPWNGYQEYDPYYELHVQHYKLYLPQFQPYPPCCFATGFVVPWWSTPIIPHGPQVIITPRPHAMRRR